MVLKILGVFALAGVGVIELSVCRSGAAATSRLDLFSGQGSADYWNSVGNKCEETAAGSGVFEEEVGKVLPATA